MNLTPEQLVVIDDQLFAGDLLGAIKAYRGFTGSQLIYAKSFVDHRHEHLQRLRPSRFPATPETPPTQEPDRKILQQITHLPARDVITFRLILTQIRELLYGCNYVPTLAVTAADIPTSELPLNELMLSLYPDSTPHIATRTPPTAGRNNRSALSLHS